jgi:plasmid stabilization system protein ParE
MGSGAPSRMKPLAVEYSLQARADLEEIALYIARDNPLAAEARVQKLVGTPAAAASSQGKRRAIAWRWPLSARW